MLNSLLMGCVYREAELGPLESQARSFEHSHRCLRPPGPHHSKGGSAARPASLNADTSDSAETACQADSAEQPAEQNNLNPRASPERRQSLGGSETEFEFSESRGSVHGRYIEEVCTATQWMQTKDKPTQEEVCMSCRGPILSIHLVNNPCHWLCQKCLLQTCTKCKWKNAQCVCEKCLLQRVGQAMVETPLICRSCGATEISSAEPPAEQPVEQPAPECSPC
jgi:hypothetical protein